MSLIKAKASNFAIFKYLRELKKFDEDKFPDAR